MARKKPNRGSQNEPNENMEQNQNSKLSLESILLIIIAAALVVQTFAILTQDDQKVVIPPANRGNSNPAATSPQQPRSPQAGPQAQPQQQIQRQVQPQSPAGGDAQGGTDEYGREPGDEHYGHDHPPQDQQQQVQPQIQTQPQQGGDEQGPDEYGRMPGDQHYGHDHPPQDQQQSNIQTQPQQGPDEYGREPGDQHYGHDHPPQDQQQTRQVEMPQQNQAQADQGRQANPNATEAAYSEKTYNFGELSMSSPKNPSHTFTVTNNGDQPLNYQRVRGDEGAQVVDYPESPIPPGETGEIKVKVDPSKAPGQGVQSFNVHLTGNTNPSHEHLILQANFQE